MTNTFDPLNDNNMADPFDSVMSPSSSDLHNGHHELNNLNGGRSRVATSSVSSIHNTHASNNFVMNNFNAGSNSRNTATTNSIYNPGNRNKAAGFGGMVSNSSAAIEDDHRNSITSHALNLYASDKALPLTVACHFKNSLHELIEKINKCKAYFIRCIKPNMNQENTFINEFVVKQLRYCSLMHVCKIRKCGFPYRIKFAEFLKWYRAIQVCVLDKSDAIARRDVNNNMDDMLQKCIKCLEYANVRDYKVGKSKLFLRYYHIDMLNSVAKKLENSVLVAQKSKIRPSV